MHIELKRICVPTDFSPQSEHALLYGLTLANFFKAELHLLHIVEDIGPVLASAEGMDTVTAAEILASVEKSAREQLQSLPPADWKADVPIVRSISHGVPFHEITRYAKTQQIDLIVMGTHGRSGLKHFLMGSVAERVVRSGPCPVLTVRHPEHEFIVPPK